MIELKDVIRMKIPYPSINARLAANSHMYICRKKEGTYYEYVKCQTLKPYMLYNNIIKHYHDEDADITRNPFVHNTGSRIISTNVVRWINRIYLFHNRGKRKLNAISARAAGKKKISIVDTFWLGTLIYGV